MTLFMSTAERATVVRHVPYQILSRKSVHLGFLVQILVFKRTSGTNPGVLNFESKKWGYFGRGLAIRTPDRMALLMSTTERATVVRHVSSNLMSCAGVHDAKPTPRTGVCSVCVRTPHPKPQRATVVRLVTSNLRCGFRIQV